MRKHNEQQIGDLLQNYFEKNSLSEKLRESTLRSRWASIVGPMIARHTLSLSLQGGVLYLRLDSSTLRNELHYARKRMINRINEELGETWVRAVKL
jgi:predicted nucleic acid-binding Zn ribbon protein